MTLADFQELARACPLVASVQASPGSPVEDPSTLARLAQASIGQGLNILRLEGRANIREIRKATGVPSVGLVKKEYPGSEVYITPTQEEITTLLGLGCEIIALDGTYRSRPNSDTLADLIHQIHAAGRLAMADCDTIESVNYSIECGADLIGTTLSGYTAESVKTTGPDFKLLRQAVETGAPIIAEGRYGSRWEVEAALRIGATAVVVGGALNDPVKTTAALKPRSCNVGRVGVVDIGGTWLRFATCHSDWQLSMVDRIPLPPTERARSTWILEKIRLSGVTRLAVSTGGTVDPNTGEVWEAKPIIPEHLGTVFSEEILGIPTLAINDGLATAWGHACLPEYAGKRVATLALGTGVGAGLVDRGRIWCGSRGEYPRLNDLAAPGGRTVEDLLGGASLTPYPSKDAIEDARIAFQTAVRTSREMYYPEVIVIAGSVGLSDWLRPTVEELGCTISPFGAEAGLKGAAALALFPPDF